ncbi:MAG TPA: response regulator transcription factor [Candidatus Polarisedimenticolaceae bacterium]|nr:response regulator transcription factor [Candidatus Polarisedimenticolaceae bacterium]
MTDRVIRVAVIEDRPDIREALELLLDETEGLAFAGAWGSMEEALPRIAPPLPDVVLVDIGLPGMSGIEGIRILARRHPALILLVLSIYAEDQRIFDALCAGATGYLVKNTPPDELIDALRQAVAGGSPMSPQIARRVIGLFRELAPKSPPDYHLTPHETRLLRLMAEGLHYRTAGERLGVTASTVSFHLQQIYRKLQVQTKSEAVAKALREGLIE